METRDPGPITQLLAEACRGDGTAHERLWAALYRELHAIALRQLAAEPPGRTLQPTSLVHEAYLRLVDAEGRDMHWESRRHFFAAAAQAMRRIRIDDARTRARLKRGGPGIGADSGADESTSAGRLSETERTGGTGPPKVSALRGLNDAGMPVSRGSAEAEAPRPDAAEMPDEPVPGSARRADAERRHRARPRHVAAQGITEPMVFDDDPVEVMAIDEALTQLERSDPRKAKVVLLRYFGGLTIDQSAEVLGVSARTVDHDWRLAKAWLHRELG